MAHPLEHTFYATKQQVMGLFPGALKALKIQVIGCHKRLGLISFCQRSGLMLYAHIVQKEHGSSRVSIAPGLPYLKEQPQSTVPKSAIKQILQKLEDIIKNDTK